MLGRMALAALFALCFIGGAVSTASARPVTVERAEPQQLLFSPLDERAVTFSADGNTMVFVIRAPNGYMLVLCTAVRVNGRWSEPEVLPFSGSDIDTDPFLTPDGQTLYFASSRSASGDRKAGLGLWRASRTASGWGAPEIVPGFESSTFNDRSPVLLSSGRLYFASSREGGFKLFYADIANGVFGKPVELGEGVNSDDALQVQLAVSPDEETLVFTSFGRPDDTFAPGEPYQRGDLYLSRLTNGVWGKAIHLPADINSAASELSPWFSPDGRYLYFASERGFATNQDVLLDSETLKRGLASVLNGRGNVYRVPVQALENQP